MKSELKMEIKEPLKMEITKSPKDLSKKKSKESLDSNRQDQALQKAAKKSVEIESQETKKESKKVIPRLETLNFQKSQDPPKKEISQVEKIEATVSIGLVSLNSNSSNQQ